MPHDDGSHLKHSYTARQFGFRMANRKDQAWHPLDGQSQYRNHRGRGCLLIMGVRRDPDCHHQWNSDAQLATHHQGSTSVALPYLAYGT